jgi:hypothetical protein
MPPGANWSAGSGRYGAQGEQEKGTIMNANDGIITARNGRYEFVVEQTKDGRSC